MPALTAGRMTKRREGDIREEAVHGSTTIFTGAIVMRDADGYLVEGQTATGLVGVGVAEKTADNGAGADGAILCRYRVGEFQFANSAAADEITLSEIGDVCFAVDDQTVAATNGSSTRSPAGIVTGVDANGVWVRFDEALTKAS